MIGKVMRGRKVGGLPRTSANRGRRTSTPTRTWWRHGMTTRTGVTTLTPPPSVPQPGKAPPSAARLRASLAAAGPVEKFLQRGMCRSTVPRHRPCRGAVTHR